MEKMKKQTFYVENNEKAAAWKPQGLKGEFFMRPQHDSRIFTIKEFQV